MYQTTVRCKSLRLAERHKDGEPQSVAVGRKVDMEEYTEAQLEGGCDKSHFFFSFPVSLLDADMRIGDEILVTFERKNR
jgi:hypothetical protein